MPHASFKLIPGVDQNKTPTLNEAAISYSQLIRFIPDRTLGGLVQKLGGWTKFYGNAIGSIVRCLWAWEDTNNNSYLAVGAEGISPIVVTGASGNGTNATLTHTTPFQFVEGNGITVSGVVPSGYNGQFTVVSSTTTSVTYANTTTAAYTSGGAIAGGGMALEIIVSGSASDITPQSSTYDVVVNFQTTAGSNAVLVTDTGRNIDGYDSVNIITPVAVGGIVLFGQYQCYNVGGSANTYTIYATNILGDPDLAVFTTTTTPLAVTGASGTGTVATITFGGAYVFPIGSVVTVLSVNPAGYNGKYVVTTSGAGTVSFASTTTAAYVSGGNVSNNGVVPLFTATNTSSSVAVLLPNHRLFVGDTFPILIVTPVGGITLSGNYVVNRVVSANLFDISANNSASSTASVYENSGFVRFLYWNGLGPAAVGTGYGIGPYGYGGYGTGSPPAVNSGTAIQAVDWTLDNWGQILISCPLNGPIFEWDPTSGDKTSLIIPSAPSVSEGIFVAMPQRQIIAWGSTFNGIKDPLLIRWCDVNDYSSWTATITNQAGSYRIPKGSRIIQCIQAGQQAILWTDIGVWAMQYVGPPYVYQFNELGNGCGLIGRKAAASVGGVVYWMGPSQFYRLAGNGVEPIRCPVWDVIFQDLDTNNVDKIRVAPNSRFGEISWYYPTSGNGGEIHNYVKYNIVLDQWDFGELARTAWINESVLGPPIGAAPNTYLFQHETSPNDDGNAMVSSFQTGYFVLNEADSKMFVDQVWPDMKWGYYGGVQNANVLLTFYVADYPGQTPVAYGPFTLTQAVDYVTPRFRGRLVSIKMESNDINSFWRIGNTRYRFQPDGKF